MTPAQITPDTWARMTWQARRLALEMMGARRKQLEVEILRLQAARDKVPVSAAVEAARWLVLQTPDPDAAEHRRVLVESRLAGSHKCQNREEGGAEGAHTSVGFLSVGLFPKGVQDAIAQAGAKTMNTNESTKETS